MAFWNRKKKPMDAMQASEAIKKAAEKLSSTPAEPTPPPCLHTWVDFPWYLQHSFNNYQDDSFPPKGESILEIYEPYVCVHCQKRKDVKLYRERPTSMTLDSHFKKIEQWNELYKDHIKPKPIVEDMINDAIYVDKGKVAIVAKLRGIEDEERKDKDSYRVGLTLR